MAEYIKYILAGYLILMNVIGFVVMGIDKRKARKHKWRIREASLFLIAAIGGSVGSWAGMYVFHHKTKHWYFVVGMPAILALQVAAGMFLYMRLRVMLL